MQDVEDAAEGDGDDPPDAEARENQREAWHSILRELSLNPCQQTEKRNYVLGC